MSWILLAGLMGCHEFTVVLEQVGSTPLPVSVGDSVVVPVGIVVTVTSYAYRDGASLELDTPIELEAEDLRVFEIDPLKRDDYEWALVAADVGYSRILPWVDGREAAPIEVEIVPQSP